MEDTLLRWCVVAPHHQLLVLSQHVYNILLLQTRIGVCDDGRPFLPDCSFYEQFDLDQVCSFVGFAFPSARTFEHRNWWKGVFFLLLLFLFALHNFIIVSSPLSSCPFDCIVAGWVVSCLFSSTLLLCVIGAAELVHKIM